GSRSPSCARPISPVRTWSTAQRIAGRSRFSARTARRGTLRFERADLVDDLTLAYVTAPIQYHLRIARPNRAMGEKLCAELRRVRRFPTKGELQVVYQRPR